MAEHEHDWTNRGKREIRTCNCGARELRDLLEGHWHPYLVCEDVADAESARASLQLVTDDLHRICQALDIGARPYSGHEAMETDILPKIRELQSARAEVSRLQRAIDEHNEDCPLHVEQQHDIDGMPVAGAALSGEGPR